MTDISTTNASNKTASSGEEAARRRRQGQKSPWGWIPTLYIAEGLPYFAVNVLTIALYTQMGIDEAAMTFYTGLLYLPWVIKPIWSPFIDIFSTKRKWTISMQLLIALTMGAVAIALGASAFFAATLVFFWIMAFASATHDIAADGYYMLELDKEQQAAYVGLRSTFYRIASVIGQGGLLVLIGLLQKRGMGVAMSWQTAFGMLAIVFGLLAVWHVFMMPKSASDKPMKGSGPRDILRNFGATFVTFFQKPAIWTALAFILLYRLPEALCIKMIFPFLSAPVNKGGLGLSVDEIGVANGVIGVIALLAGGIVGGLLIAKGGLKKWLWPMALSLTLPCAFYAILAMTQPSSFWITAAAIGVEQFGYGFGFTAFMMYMMYFSQGPNSTSHYAFCTAFMAAGMMLPGMAAGWIWEQLRHVSFFGIAGELGYINFFWLVVICSIATFGVSWAVRKKL